MTATTALKRISWPTLQAYLQLMRPANIITAWADILAGYGAGIGTAGMVLLLGAGLELQGSLLWLLIATTGLYGGGVTFNDVFDASLDATERTERPIPSGRASLLGAACLGIILLAIGVGAAAQVSLLSGELACAIALLALTYNKFSKHHTVIGPVNMGLCRGLNLLLGVSAVAGQVETLWVLAIIPLGYIGAITAISQGEVHGSDRATALSALLLLSLTIGTLFALSCLPMNYLPNIQAANIQAASIQTANTQTAVQIWHLLPFAGLLSALVFPSFLRAAHTLTAQASQDAVKAGILALIVLDAAIAAGFSEWPYGLAVLGLLPLSKGVSRLFAMT
jgi:4-hydroxybenzoate polyprenyltransferase